MKHRFLITALAFGMLTGAVSTTIVPTQPVQAISKKVAVNHGYRKVTLTKTVRIRKIHKRVPTYKSTLGPTEYADKKLTVKLMQVGTDFGWYLKIPSYRGTWTVSKRYNDYSWFKLGWHY